jgi:hypothetical protein
VAKQQNGVEDDPGSLGLAGNPIKKLPQVGQEPVEAVESRHSSPDRPMIINPNVLSKDIPAKIPIIFRNLG